MTKKQIKKLDKIIKSLDEAVGRLIVHSMRDKEIKIAMEIVSKANFSLGELINE